MFPVMELTLFVPASLEFLVTNVLFDFLLVSMYSFVLVGYLP